MAIRDHDRKKLWGRSGGICSFPGCDVELAPLRGNSVIGEEAHISGKTPRSARHDPNQSPEERDSYENLIDLCPTHHTLIDADPDTWTVPRLLRMKEEHERQVENDRVHPRIMGELKRKVEEFQVPKDHSEILVNEIMTGAQHLTVRVDASAENGVDSGIKVSRGQKIAFFARGLISYDGGYHFATPEGILCNELGLALLGRDDAGHDTPVVWPHEQAHRTDGGRLGLIGSLFGWINQYSEESAFFIGSKGEIEVAEEGRLFLAANDAKGTYSDNDGEYRVEIRVTAEAAQEFAVVQPPYFNARRDNKTIVIDTSNMAEPSGSVGQQIIVRSIKGSRGPQGPIEDE